jgi:hypothetical protein
MAAEGNLKSNLYKLEIVIIKVLPFVIAALYILSTILDYIDICSTLVNYIVYLMFFLFLYVSSYVFKFCGYHRMPIHYALGINLINVYDVYVGIPVDNYSMFGIYSIFTGIAIFITVYLYVRSYKKSTNKDNR